MKQEASFDDLIQAIQEAFIKVNNMSEAQHLQKISDYFNPDSTPKTFDISYPVFNDDGNIENRVISIPSICLMPMSSLKLDEVEVDFKVRLYGGVKLNPGSGIENIGEKSSDSLPPSNMLKSSKKAEKDTRTYIGYFPQGYTRKSKEENYANIRLKFVSDEPPEGLMRIQEQYTKISL